MFVFHLQLLEFWCTFPTATTPCSWFTRYLLFARFIDLIFQFRNLLFRFPSDGHLALKSLAPSTTKELPEDYVERVKRVHESGGYDSRGYAFSDFQLFITKAWRRELIADLFPHGRYGYDWKRDEANKNLLRTHTTAVSSRMLYLLAQVLCQRTKSNLSYYKL